MNISDKAHNLKPSGIRAFFDLVMGSKDILSLGVGEPDFVTPWNIRESAIYSIEKGYTSYTSNKGHEELRKELSHFLKKKYNAAYHYDNEILITVGVSEGLDLSLRAIINPGDKVLIPEPCYVSYEPLVTLAGGIPVLVSTKEKDGFKIPPETLKKEIEKGIKAVLFNYPSNPTGMSYSEKEIQEIARIIDKHDAYIISDETYDELTYDFTHTSLCSFPRIKEKLIYLNGFSKTYAMTGWRVGYVCGSEDIVNAMTKIHQYTIMCVNTPSQLAAITALKHSQNDVSYMKKEYDMRRHYVVKRLNEIGLKCHMPDGAFYAFPSIKKTGMSSMEFCKKLLKKEKVAVVPGNAFGDSGEGNIRISYASSIERLKEALNRIEQFLMRL
ncbi:MAG: aminotransferase class I/II-fold pyridoxal phosphate-dependent enzyme [Candidatus Ancaeobacter aquaticus]|nr:aminotransferase class I/II-fold pyridoxal phosphate-dependent enzyme [Candidatus Ancaeobacter aquaticus]